VAFFGPDGAGKTTHVDLLLTFYREKGMKARKAWIRANHTLAFVVSRFFVRLGYYRVAPNPMRRPLADPAWGRAFVATLLPPIRRVWPLIEFMSVLPLVILRVLLPLHLGYAVVAERYVIDSVVAIAYITGDPTFPRRSLGRALLRLIPRNSVMIYLRASYATILERRKENAHGPEFITFQLAMYDEFAKNLGSPIIDTSLWPVEQTQQILRRILTDGPRAHELPTHSEGGLRPRS